MATPAEVLELFARFRAESGIDRARAAGAALRGFGSLSTEDKRELAVLVAQRAAPELVPRIREQTGIDLSSEQIEVVLDLVRNLDDEDIDELRRTVTDPEAREAALRSTAQATAAAAVTAAGLDDDIDDLPPPPPHLVDGGRDEASTPADDELAAADAALADAERRRQEIEERAERELAEAREELEELTTGDAEEAALEFADPTELDEVPAEYEPVFRPRDLPGKPVPADLASRDVHRAGRGARWRLAERVREAGTDGAKLRVLTDHLDQVLDLTGEQVTEVLLAIPDGWARRRAVERLLENDAILAREVPATVRLLGRASDRTWVAATAVEARLLEPDQLDDLLDARAAARLRRRYG